MQANSFGMMMLTCSLLASCSNPEPEPELYPDSLFANAPASDSGAIAELQGRWISDDNSEREIEVAGSDFLRFENGSENSRGPIVFVKDCSTGEADPEGSAFVVREGGEKTCYIMSQVTEEKLVFIHGKRGRMSRFTRKLEE